MADYWSRMRKALNHDLSGVPPFWNQGGGSSELPPLPGQEGYRVPDAEKVAADEDEGRTVG